MNHYFSSKPRASYNVAKIHYSFLATHLIIPLLIALPVLILFEITAWDIHIQQFFYIAETSKWLISQKGWVEKYLHDGGKTLTHIYANVCILGLLLSFFKRTFKPFKSDFIFLILAITLSTGAVAELKQLTNIWCPSQITLFNGMATYVKIFEPRMLVEGRGVCWPSGHASAGFAFVSAYFVVRRYWPRYAIWALLGGLSMGFVYGSVRMLQGLHFFSHILWSGIICWVIMVVLSMVVFKENRAVRPL